MCHWVFYTAASGRRHTLSALTLNFTHVGEVCQEGLWSRRWFETWWHGAVLFAMPVGGTPGLKSRKPQRKLGKQHSLGPNQPVNFLHVYKRRELLYRGKSTDAQKIAFIEHFPPSSEIGCTALPVFNQPIKPFPSQFTTSGNVHTKNTALSPLPSVKNCRKSWAAYNM